MRYSNDNFERQRKKRSKIKVFKCKKDSIEFDSAYPPSILNY